MDFENTKKYLNEQINKLNIPYFSCIVKKDGKEIFTFDYKDKDKNNDLLLMYSMSKPITAVCLLQLLQKGLINLNDPVSKYLPNFDNLINLKTKEKITKEIRINNLLSMTSGLDYDLHRKSIKELVKNKPNASTKEMCSIFAKDGLVFSPGESFQYSLSMDVVAAIIEIVSKERFSTYVKKNVFDKLGMNDSTFKRDLKLASKARDEYYPTSDFSSLEKIEKLYEGFLPTSEYESGGAGLISTVKDYSLFVDSLANRRNVILDDKIVDEMATVRVKDTPFNDSVKEYSKSSIDYGYGYGVRVRKHDSSEGIPEGEFGWDGATGSYSLIDRKNHISIVIGMTIANWPSYVNDLHIRFVKSIYNAIFSK